MSEILSERIARIMNEKQCSKCGLVKVVSEFYKNIRRTDGPQRWCKECHARYARSAAGKVAIFRWNHSPAKTRYNHSAAGKAAYARYDAEYRLRFPERIKAGSAVNNAVHAGRLVRQPCEVCGAEPTHGHHEDYSKPLCVKWLCRGCHDKLHRSGR